MASNIKSLGLEFEVNNLTKVCAHLSGPLRTINPLIGAGCRTSHHITEDF